MKMIRVLALLASLELQSTAAVILFTDESDFLADTGPLGFEGFEETEPGLTGTSRFLTHFILSPSTEDGTFENLEIIRDSRGCRRGSTVGRRCCAKHRLLCASAANI